MASLSLRMDGQTGGHRFYHGGKIVLAVVSFLGAIVVDLDTRIAPSTQPATVLVIAAIAHDITTIRRKPTTIFPAFACSSFADNDRQPFSRCPFTSLLTYNGLNYSSIIIGR